MARCKYSIETRVGPVAEEVSDMTWMFRTGCLDGPAGLPIIAVSNPLAPKKVVVEEGCSDGRRKRERRQVRF